MFGLREFARIALTVSLATSAAAIWQAAGREPGESRFAHRSLSAVLDKPIAVKPMHLSRFKPRIELSGGPALPADAKAEVERPPAPIVLDPGIESAMAQDVAARLSRKVPERLTPYFDLFFYVSKSASGPWAQRLFVFRKTAAGKLEFEESFPVSTGRERDEKYFTATPTGIFQLDPSRFMPLARSAKWNDALMPWAMFLNYSYRTQMSGVALHAAIGRRELADLGHRASGGCVRLPLDKANAWYHRIKATMGGSVPVFAFDEARGTTSTAGEMLKDQAGNVMVASGYRVLVVIDSYAGEEPRSS